MSRYVIDRWLERQDVAHPVVIVDVDPPRPRRPVEEFTSASFTSAPDVEIAARVTEEFARFLFNEGYVAARAGVVHRLRLPDGVEDGQTIVEIGDVL